MGHSRRIGRCGTPTELPQHRGCPEKNQWKYKIHGIQHRVPQRVGYRFLRQGRDGVAICAAPVRSGYWLIGY